MRRLINRYSFLFLTLIVCSAEAQETIKEDWLPIFECSMPTRFFTVKYDVKFNSKINSKSSISEIGNSESKINQDRIAAIDLKFPILNNKKFKLAGSAKYFDEEMYFERGGSFNYPLYVSLQDRNLKNIGGGLNGIYHLGGNRSLIARSSFYLAGDFYRSGSFFSYHKIMKISFAIGYGIKKDPCTYYAFGLYWGYTFGVPSIYPAAALYKRFHNDIGIDLLLPQSAKIWKKVNDRFYIYANSKISGNSYTIKLRNSILDEAESLQLRKSSIISSIGVTHQLGKWIWMEAEAGISNSMNFNLSETNFKSNSSLPTPDKDYLIKSELGSSPHFSISLFLALPKGFLSKFKK